MEAAKKILKNESLFKEGDKIDKVFLIQAGRVSLFIGKGNSKVEIAQLGAGQIAGLLGGFGLVKHPYSAEALVNVTFVEMPMDVLKAQLDAVPNVGKVVIKSLSEEVKNNLNSMKTLKMKEEPSPCPQISIPRLFGSIFLFAHTYGNKKNDEILVNWQSIRTYAVRVFLEAPVRLESALTILSKLGYVTLKKALNDDGIEELSEITFNGVGFLQDFVEFYQFNLYKPGRSEIMYYDPFVYPRLKELVQFASDKDVDRNGAVKLHFDTASQALQNVKGGFKLEHIAFFERKGLFMKRTVEGDQTYIAFDKAEYTNVYQYWRLIHEIDRWNETGKIDMAFDDELVVQEESASTKCPECQGEIKAEHKFCPHCGAKLG